MNTVVKSGRTAVTADPSHSHSLPGWAYLDPALFQREKEEIFYKTWHYAGWVGDLKTPGDYITADLIDQNVMILRGADGQLQGFHNVCQHRSHQLLSHRGHVDNVACPYHAWTYQLDGTLKTARGAEKLRGFNAAQFHLKPVRVEVFAEKFVFYNLDDSARRLSDLAGDLAEDIRKEVPFFDDLVRYDRTRKDPLAAGVQNANWKIVMDNAQECYHCRSRHRHFTEYHKMETYKTETHGYWSRQQSEPRKFTKSVYTEATGAKNNKVRFWWMFPNATMSMRTADPLRLNIGATVPIDVSHTRFGGGDLYSLPGTPEQPSAAPSIQREGVLVYDSDVTRKEDAAINESVQRGLASKGYDSGRFIYDPEHFETTEEAVHVFHRRIVEALKL